MVLLDRIRRYRYSLLDLLLSVSDVLCVADERYCKLELFPCVMRSEDLDFTFMLTVEDIFYFCQWKMINLSTFGYSF